MRQRISLRRRRNELFPPGLFADPAWDMLLDLYGVHIAQHRVPVSSLCIAAAVPATTALRWIGKLEKGWSCGAAIRTMGAASSSN